MNECLFCKLTNWLLSLDWNFLFPYFLIFFFCVVLSFGVGIIVGCKDYEDLYNRWESEKMSRESLERKLGL